MLGEVKASKAAIFKHVAVRMMIVLVMIGGWIAVVINSEQNNANIVYLVIAVLLVLVYALSPLRYFNRVLQFYPDKITLGKKEINFQHPSEMQWTKQSTYHAGTRLILYKKLSEKSLKQLFLPASNELDVTYMMNPMDEFAKCYCGK